MGGANLPLTAMIQQLVAPPCLPVSITEARKHLAIDTGDSISDTLISLLIEAATSDSQLKTGRIWVEQDWLWKPDCIVLNSELRFPIVPVIDVALYDLTPPPPPEPEPEPEPDPEPSPEEPPAEPVEPPVEPEEPPTPPENNEEIGPVGRRKRSREGEIPPETETPPSDENPPDNPDNPDTPQDPDTPPEEEEPLPNVIAEYADVFYPSLDPMGRPAIGHLIPRKEFPAEYKLVLKVGYPVSKTEVPEAVYDNPILLADKTQYSANRIRLIFTRPVSGVIHISNFEVRRLREDVLDPPCPPDPDVPGTGDGNEDGGSTAPPNPDDGNSGGGENGGTTPEVPETPVRVMRKRKPRMSNRTCVLREGFVLTILDAEFIDGAIELTLEEGAIIDGDELTVSFVEGAAYDEFNNFVQPIITAALPVVSIIPETEFLPPEPVQLKDVYESLAPAAVKTWILVRIGTLYTQRTEIALRAGKSNDAMFPNQFVNNLLDPYRVTFF